MSFLIFSEKGVCLNENSIIQEDLISFIWENLFSSNSFKE